MKFFLTTLTTFIVLPTGLLGFIDSKFTALVYLVSFISMIIFCVTSYFISRELKKKKERETIQRYQNTNDLSEQNYFCAFDANELEEEIKSSYFKDFESKKTETVYGIVLEVTSNPHVGTEIHYWSKGQKKQCTAWRNSSQAKTGQFIKLTLIDATFIDGSIYKTPIKIELESTN